MVFAATSAPQWLQHPIFAQPMLGSTLGVWTLAALIAAGFSLVFLIAKWLIAGHLAALDRRHPTVLLGYVVSVTRRMGSWFLLAIAGYLGVLLAGLPERFVDVAGKVAVLILLLQAVRWGGLLINHGLDRYQRKRIESDPGAVTTMQAAAFLGRLVLWSVVALLALENLGVDVTALIAGVGVAGIAVGLALQSVLGDLFASLAIVIDKPFVVGDFLIVDEFLGTVEHIGLKTTRLRSLSGEQVVFGNSDLLSSRIRNYKRMQERRVVVLLNLAYQTPHERIEAMPGLLREATEGFEDVRFDRAHFKHFGEHALVFELVYWVLSSDYAVFMDRQQAVNLAIHRRMQEADIAFAYPTSMLYLERSGGEQPARPRSLG